MNFKNLLLIGNLPPLFPLREERAGERRSTITGPPPHLFTPLPNPPHEPGCGGRRPACRRAGASYPAEYGFDVSPSLVEPLALMGTSHVSSGRRDARPLRQAGC